MQHIDDVKNAHLEWLKRAEELVNGTLKDNIAPLECEECKCSELIKPDNFSNIDSEIVEEIETIHFLLHDNYVHIYELLADNEAPSNEDLENAKEYFEMLKSISDSLVESLESLR
jgi:hypothetical protein